MLSGLEASGQSQPDDIRPQLTGSVADDPDDAVRVRPADGGHASPTTCGAFRIIVPAGTRYLRVALFNQNSSPGADLDLYLYSCPGFGTCTQEPELPSVEARLRRGRSA